MFVHICIIDPESEERIGYPARVRVVGLYNVQEAGEEKRGRYFPIERTTAAVSVNGPYYAIAIRVEKGAVLLEDLRRRKCE